MPMLGDGRMMPWSRSLAATLLGLTLMSGCGAPQLFEEDPVGPDASEAVVELGDDGSEAGGADSNTSDPDASDSNATSDPDDAPVSSASVRATAAAAGSLPATLEARSTAAARSTTRAGRVATARPEATNRSGATARASNATATATSERASDPEAYIGRVAEGGELGGIYSLTGLRSGQHEGFTRLVWEMEPHDGAQTSGPAFRAEEKAGGPGGARIELSLSDVYGYDFVGAMDLDTPDSELVSGLNLATNGDDAILRFVVELSRPARFAVVLLEKPVRLVLDVYDD